MRRSYAQGGKGESLKGKGMILLAPPDLRSSVKLERSRFSGLEII